MYTGMHVYAYNEKFYLTINILLFKFYKALFSIVQGQDLLHTYRVNYYRNFLLQALYEKISYYNYYISNISLNRRP